MSSTEPVRAGGFIYLSGISAAAPGRNVGAATRQALGDAQSALRAAGSSLDQALSVLVLLESAADFAAMNDAYREFWKRDFPTRTTLVTQLATPGSVIEMSIIAAEGERERTIVHPLGWAVSPSPYSYAIKSGDTVFLSGLVSRNGRDNSAVAGDVSVQTRTILDNAGELLRAAGLSFANIVSSRVYLPAASSFAGMNDAYGSYFPSAPPARATAQTALAGPQYDVEITFTASSSQRRVVMEGLPPDLKLPLSAAIVAGERAYLSGALGFNDANLGDAAAQTRETLTKLRRTLAAAGHEPSDVAEATVFVPSLGDLPEVDREYQAFFGTHKPARTTIRSGLMASAGLVEIMLTAVKR
jgi:2-iminobutanoate/2-iminopropanoate deaminase